MNSLNIVSRLTPGSRSSSSAGLLTLSQTTEGGTDGSSGVDYESLSQRLENEDTKEEHDDQDSEEDINEKSHLYKGNEEADTAARKSRSWLPRRALDSVLQSVTVIFSAIVAPCRYVIACFYDEQGYFSAILPLKRLRNFMSRRRRKSLSYNGRSHAKSDSEESDEKNRKLRRSSRRSPSIDSDTLSISTGNGSDTENNDDSPARHTRSRASSEQRDELAPQKKNARVRLLHNDEALRKRKTQRAQVKKLQAADPNDVATIATALKSPSSPASTSSKLTRYPRTPAPPRPLVPRRQPSYTLSYSADTPKKTLIIDLDETLIHSMAKGGRMSTGHMVEVRLGGPVSSSGVQIGPGVPILYYVHERPGCHDFLRKVCKWFNLIVFTASVQEYADPVIDWLERERKYFSGRYYRQHCTFRNGAYIKDLAQVEPDLSKVMILDNSPMSYIFHEDNAIPIEGWISDPTDNDLLHLVPLLEGLQYVTDVRALLALRQGQAQQA